MALLPNGCFTKHKDIYPIRTCEGTGRHYETDERPTPDKFTIEPHTDIDKRFKVHGPDDFEMIIDYDDVNHKLVDRCAQHMVDILNKHWGEESLYREDDFPDDEDE